MVTIRSISMVLGSIAFFVVCWWAFSPSRKKSFEDAAQLPFADEDLAQPDLSDSADSNKDENNNDDSSVVSGDSETPSNKKKQTDSEKI